MNKTTPSNCINYATIYAGMTLVNKSYEKTDNKQQQLNNLLTSGIASGILTTPITYSTEVLEKAIQTKVPNETLISNAKRIFITNLPKYRMIVSRNAITGLGVAAGSAALDYLKNKKS